MKSFQKGLNKMNFIQFQNINKTFESEAGHFQALKDINFNIGKGEYIAVVGKSGSGKSTLLNMLTGIDHPTQGTVTINNTNIHTLKESKLAKWRGINIGIVFQFFQLIPTLTVRENLLLAMDFVEAIPKKERKIRTKELLEEVNILQHSDKLPAALSGGEQQRAAIARALANNPSILVADEPTGNLDSKTTEAIQKLFEKLLFTGKTIVAVTHEDVSIAHYSRVITLHDGLIVDDGKNYKSRLTANLNK